MERIIVTVEADLEDLIEGFIVNRQLDTEKLHQAIAEDDFETIRITGHTMKGIGSGYGFDFISILGAKIENSGIQQNKMAAEMALDMLNWYLGKIRTEIYGEG